MLYDDQIKSLLIITLCTFRKEYDKGFRVIDPLNEQNIVIIEESHDWPNIIYNANIHLHICLHS